MYYKIIIYGDTSEMSSFTDKYKNVDPYYIDTDDESFVLKLTEFMSKSISYIEYKKSIDDYGDSIVEISDMSIREVTVLNEAYIPHVFMIHGHNDFQKCLSIHSKHLIYKKYIGIGDDPFCYKDKWKSIFISITETEKSFRSKTINFGDGSDIDRDFQYDLFEEISKAL